MTKATPSSAGSSTGLSIRGLEAMVDGRPILRGVDLDVEPGRVEVLMGPNGSGKSTLQHVLMGRRGYVVTGGSITLDGEDLLPLATHERAAKGLFAGLQYPVEVPGVRLADVLAAAGVDTNGRLSAEAARVGVDGELLDRSLNVDLSGGEKKRLETMQLALSGARVAVLDEIDSGLDIDGLRDVAARVEALTNESTHGGGAPLGVLAVTHYARLLTVLRPDRVHVFMAGRIVKSGGPELAEELERTGYEGLAAQLGIAQLEAVVEEPDPFGDPGF